MKVVPTTGHMRYERKNFMHYITIENFDSMFSIDNTTTVFGYGLQCTDPTLGQFVLKLVATSQKLAIY